MTHGALRTFRRESPDDLIKGRGRVLEILNCCRALVHFLARNLKNSWPLDENLPTDILGLMNLTALVARKAEKVHKLLADPEPLVQLAALEHRCRDCQRIGKELGPPW